MKTKVLDKGFIEVVDSLGNDLTVVNSLGNSLEVMVGYNFKIEKDKSISKYKNPRFL